MDDILFLPVKPKWAKLIMSGEKTLELRKRLPLNGWGKRCVIYSTSPRYEVVGTCMFVDCGRIVVATDEVLKMACVTSAEFDAYFGVGERHYIELMRPTMLTRPIPLAVLRSVWQLEPPQQWRYISEAMLNEIVKAGQ